jgi:hypothetical protein
VVTEHQWAEDSVHVSEVSLFQGFGREYVLVSEVSLESGSTIVDQGT